MIRNASCFQAGATKRLMDFASIGMSFKIDSISSTVRARSSSASSTSGLIRLSSASGHGAKETMPLSPRSPQSASQVKGMKGARRRTHVRQRSCSTAPPPAPSGRRRRYHFRSASTPKNASWSACRVWNESSAAVAPSMRRWSLLSSQASMGVAPSACFASLTVFQNRSICFLVDETSSFLQSKSCQGSALPTRNILTVSAPNSSRASSSRKTFPLLEDIFAPFRRPIPKTTMPRGCSSCGKMARWWKSWNVRWFDMRSFAENR